MSPRKLIGPIVTIVLGGAFVAVLGLVLHQSLSPAVAARVEAASSPSPDEQHHVFVHLSTYPDSMAGEHGKDGGANPDWVSYGPGTNIRVPAHSLVTLTIDQYDGGEAITNPWFAKVHGTVDGTEIVDGKADHADRPRDRRPHVDPACRTHRPGRVVRQRTLASRPGRRPPRTGQRLPQADRGHDLLPDQGPRHLHLELRVPLR